MVWSFDLKQAIAGMFFRNDISRIISKEEELLKLEDKIFGKVEDFNRDIDSVQDLRYKNRNNIVKLQSALARVDIRSKSGMNESFDIENKTIAQFRDYEKNLRNQAYDIKKIIELLREIISDERKETVLDIMTPFAVVNEYFNGRYPRSVGLKWILRDKKLDNETFSKLNGLIDDINRSYKELIEIALQYVGKETKYFSENSSLSDYLRERGKLKRQLNGKTQALISQILMFEKNLNNALKGVSDKSLADELSANFAFFKKHFIGNSESTGLIQFCTYRLQISNRVIHDAAKIQSEKWRELDALKNNLNALYSEFVENQQKFKGKSSAYLGKQADNRIKRFTEYQNSLNNDVTRLNDFVISVEGRDLDILKKEEYEIRNVRRDITNMNNKFAAMVALFIGISVISHRHGGDNASISAGYGNTTKNTTTLTMIDDSTRAANKSINYVDAKKIIPLVGPSLDSDKEIRKSAFDDATSMNTKIKSSLSALGVKGDKSYLTALYLEKKFSANDNKFKNDRIYIREIHKSIKRNDTNYDNKDYMYSLIDTVAPKMLPGWISPTFIKGMLIAESSARYFQMSWAGASGPYQIMRKTWYDYTTLDYDTYVWDPEISLIIALKHTLIIYDFLKKNDTRWETYDILTQLATIAAVYNCGQKTYADYNYRIENFKPGETVNHYNTILAYLKENITLLSMK